MQIIIEPHGTYAIYEQIVNQMKNAIISGELSAGKPCLPSEDLQQKSVSASLPQNAPMKSWKKKA